MVPRVVHRQEQSENSICVIRAAGDVVCEGRRVGGAMVNDGGKIVVWGGVVSAGEKEEEREG